MEVRCLSYTLNTHILFAMINVVQDLITAYVLLLNHSDDFDYLTLFQVKCNKVSAGIYSASSYAMTEFLDN